MLEIGMQKRYHQKGNTDTPNINSVKTVGLKAANFIQKLKNFFKIKTKLLNKLYQKEYFTSFNAIQLK